MKTSLLLLTITLVASPAVGADPADDWCGTLWKRSDYHGFAMQENWRAAMREVGLASGAANPASNGGVGGQTARPAKKTAAVAGNPTGKRVRRKTPVDDGPIAPTVIAPVR